MAITAAADKKGYFKQGDWGLLLLQITDSTSNPVNPEYINVTIYKDSTEVDFDSNVPMQVDEGCFVFEWVISEIQEIGEYNVDWEYTVDGDTYYEYQTVVVTTGTGTANAPILYNERLIAMREQLEKYLEAVQQIPVYFEQAKPSRDRRIFEFSFPRWNQSSRVKIYRNQQIINTGFEINYFKGTVTFDSPQLPQDIINADYDFRWFSDDDIDVFLNNAVQEFNMFPPYSGYNLLNISNPYVPAVIYGAARNALRTILLGIQNQEKAMVFGGGEASQQVFSNLDSLKQNFEKDWDKLTDNKKYGRYPKIAMNVVPEYTLPGGRSRWFRYLFKG